MLKSRGSVHWPRVPQWGHGTEVSSTVSGSATLCFSAYPSCRWSARNRLWQCRHSTSGSVNTPTWPEATQT